MRKSRDYIVRNPNEISLLDLPSEVVIAIVSSGSKTDNTQIMNKLSNTGKVFNNFFQPDIDKQAAKQLLQYVLQGNPTKAKEMYEANPRLMFIEVREEAYAAGVDENGIAAHRTVVESPYRAALSEGDAEIYNDMLKYFDHVFDQISDRNGYEIAKAQLTQQFPHGFDYLKSSYDFSALVNTITSDTQLAQSGQPSAATESILAQFRKDFTPGVVKSGHHFNLNDLINACKVYNQNWRPWNHNQLSLFWRQVIGFLQRLVTAYDAQAFRQGIDNIAEGKQLLSRNFQLHNYVNNKKILYFPLDEDLSCRLGFGFGVDTYFKGIWRVSWTEADAWRSVIEKLCLAKATNLEEFRVRLQLAADQFALTHTR